MNESDVSCVQWIYTGSPSVGSESNWLQAKLNRNYHTEAGHKVVSILMRNLERKVKDFYFFFNLS